MARLAFFGTPEFAVVSLKALHRFCFEKGHDLVLVVTKPDQRQGRGKKMTAPAVKILAQKLGIKIKQPTTLLKNTDDGDKFYQEFIDEKIDLVVVVAYGKIITQRLLSAPTLHFINIHGSLLPRFRGAAPVQRAIMAGDQETGVCLMDMVLKLDEGDVFTLAKTPIIPSDTSTTLFRRLAHLGANLLYENLDNLLQQKLIKIPQSKNSLVYAHMLSKEEGQINFADCGRTIHNKVRAFDIWPNIHGFINGYRVKFFNSFFVPNKHAHIDKKPGTIVCINLYLGIKTIDGILYFQNIQLEGKKILPIHEAIKNLPAKIGDQVTANTK